MLRLNFDNKLQNVNLTNITKDQYTLTANGGATHTDILRLREGRVGGQFWAVKYGIILIIQQYYSFYNNVNYVRHMQVVMALEKMQLFSIWNSWM